MALGLSGCGPKAEGSYAGGVRNQSYGVEASLFLKLQDRDGLITGTMTIGAPLFGGGDVFGRRDGKNIQFTTSDASGGRIVWIGQVNGAQIDGDYVVEPNGMAQVLVGADKQQGIWAVKR